MTHARSFTVLASALVLGACASVRRSSPPVEPPTARADGPASAGVARTSTLPAPAPGVAGPASNEDPCCLAPSDAEAGAGGPAASTAAREGLVPASANAVRGEDGVLEAGAVAELDVRLPDVELIDQLGRPVRFESDVAAGRVVVLQFVFTTCTTICPPLGANFARLERLLADTPGRPVQLVSVSVDPLRDTPERMKAFGERFGAGPGWTLLTGKKREIDRLLKAFGVFTPDPASHAPLVIVGDADAGRWRRVDGLAPPEVLGRIVGEVRSSARDGSPGGAIDEAPPSPPSSGAHAYFTDVELTDQSGEPRRLYSDLIRGKTVVIDCFFTECTGVCPVLTRTMAAVQAAVGERLGSEVHLLSFSVDPARDTPERLAEYAREAGARPGWYFLTGAPAELRLALAKLGLSVEDRESHSNLVLVGNDRTGLWKKAFGLAGEEAVVRVVESVLEDDVP